MSSAAKNTKAAASTKTRQPKKGRSVYLVDGESFPGASRCPVVLGKRVRDDVAHRSAMLSHISTMKGEAALPAGISPEDFRVWQAAMTLSVHPSTSELVQILKVQTSPHSLALAIEKIFQR